MFFNFGFIDDLLILLYYNFIVDYVDCIFDEDYFMLLFYVLGGVDVFEVLLKDC